MAANAHNSEEAKSNMILRGDYILCRAASTWLGNKAIPRTIPRLLKDSATGDKL